MNLFRFLSVTLSSFLLFITAAACADQPALRFCVCTNAMPRAGKTAHGNLEGIDVATARLFAEMLGRSCEFHACPSDACRLQNLRTGQCDVVVGLPHESVKSPEIAWTKAYASGKFGLLVPSSEKGVRSLIEMKGKRVGVVSGTVPLSPKEHHVVGFPSSKAMLRGFDQANLDAALIDVDYAAWYLRQHADLKLRLVDEYVSTHRWSIGMAVRAEDIALRDKLSHAVEICLEEAKLRRLFSNFGLTFRPPLSEEQATTVEGVLDTWKRITEGGTLVVSMDPANLPYSSADPKRPGFDVEIAQAVAQELGIPMRIEWIDVHRETAVGQLLEHECDLAFGAAIDPQAIDDEEELAGRVIYSKPYYGTGYLLVARDNAERVASLAELQGEQSRRLGTQAGTIADYSLRQRGYLRRLFGTQLATLTALENGGIDYAYLWSNVGWLLHQSPDMKASILPDYAPEDQWNIAIAMRSGDQELKQQVDRALSKVIQKGVVSASLQKYHVPYYPPFDSDTKSSDGTRHGPVNRGLEPQMSHRRVSVKSYDGMARIRSRGTLVVGLDQNNLPFSAAHPQPTGLDYEIAQLLAQQLGVSLEVYWAYSSHDSYPSKLADKRLCDLILGVMPDDRFADRVAYSEPYYHVNFEYAVPAASDKTALNEQHVAAEPGIAARGLVGREVKHYLSLEAILAAVARAEEPLGYVISSRAHWLAAEKWPGKIRFVPTGSVVDRFEVCAAVRRNETDLKTALDEAFEDLRRKGLLQQAFARWHVPLDQ